MSPDLEHLVRAAQERVAQTARPAVVRAGIPGRVARIRRRRAVAAVAAAAAVVVVVAVGVPVLAAPRHRSPLPAASPTAVDRAGMPLRYRVTWLPPGLVEKVRSTPVRGQDDPRYVVARTWTAQPLGRSAGSAYTDKGVTLVVRRAGTGDVPAAGDPVDVNGAPGRVQPDSVGWKVGTDELTVEDGHLGLSRDDLLRVARSVRADASTSRSPLAWSWLPAGFVAGTVAVSGDTPASWQVALFADRSDGATLCVRVAGDTDAPQGGPLLDVAGHPARARDGDGDSRSRFLVVNLDDAGLLTVTATWPAGADPPPPADLARVASTVLVTPGTAATAWIGR